MRHDPANPKWPDRDRFILSKGHAAPGPLQRVRRMRLHAQGPTQHAAQARLHLSGPSGRALHSRARSVHRIARRRPLDRHRHGARRQTRSAAPRAPTSCWATAKSRKAKSGKRPCSAGDKNVDNLVAIVDYNHIQLDGFVNDIMPLDPLPDKWRAFNWHTIDLDGHSIPALQAAFAEAAAHQGPAHRDHRPHHQRKRRLIHGEQSEVPRRRAHAGRNGKSTGGAGIDGNQNQIRTQARNGHARSFRQSAGGGRPQQHRHRGARRRSLEVHLHALLRQGISRPLLRMRHRRSQHDRHRRRPGFQRQDSVRRQLLLLRHQQRIRATARRRGLSQRKRQSGGHAQRHLDRRRRPVADEHRGSRPGLLAARLHGALAGRRSRDAPRWCTPRPPMSAPCSFAPAAPKRPLSTRPIRNSRSAAPSN